MRIEDRVQAQQPQELAQRLHNMPLWIHLASRRRRDEIYEAFDSRLRAVRPDELGIEDLLNARLIAATCGEISRGSRLRDHKALDALLADLFDLEYPGDPREAWKLRGHARRHVASKLQPFAERLRRRGDHDGALAVYRTISRTGAMTEADRAAHCRLLWHNRHKDPEARLACLQYLEKRNWVAEDEFDRRLQGYLEDELTIKDSTPDGEAADRLSFVLRAMAGGGRLDILPLSAGLGYLRLNDPARALPYLRDANANNGHDGGVRAYHLATALFLTGEFEDALKKFQEAIERGFPRSQVAGWQGLAFAKSDRWDEALQTFREAETSIGPDVDANFFVYWGRASFLTRAFEEAEKRFRQAVERAASQRKHAEEETGQDDPAREALVRARHGLAVCHARAQRVEDAITELETAIHEHGSFAPVAHLLGRLLENCGHHDRALDHYRAAVKASPNDPAYVASLGYALHDAGDAAGLECLERVAQKGNGGAEAVRRLAFGYWEHGDRSQAGSWLSRLEVLAPDNDVVKGWLARCVATEATEAFNQGDYSKSVERWNRVEEALPGERVRHRLALAMLCDAAKRLRDSGTDPRPLWEQVAAAHGLSPTPESAFLHALCLLMQGDYDGARSGFEARIACEDDRPELRFFAALAGCLVGDRDAEEELSRMEAPAALTGLEALLKFLQVQMAVTRDDFACAAKHLEEWAEIPDCLRVIGLDREQVNGMVLGILERGYRRRLKVIRFLESLNKLHDAYWTAALLVARHREATPGKLADANEEKIEACDRAYIEARDKAPDDRMLQAGHAELLRYAACMAVARGDLVGAKALLERLDSIPLAQNEDVETLRALVEDRLARPSHQKAWALAHRDSAQACAIWEELLGLDEDDELALHHLAVLHWSRGYDLVREATELPASKKEETKQKLSEAIESLASGLRRFQALYARPGYWDGLQEKGRVLHTAANPFDADAFGRWREGMLVERAGVFVRLALNLASDFEVNARQAMQAMRACGASSDEVEAMAKTFADRLLDPDPTNLPNFEGSVARAEKTLKIDPDNFEALRFIVRACAFRLEEGERQQDADWVAISNRIGAAKSRAEELGKRVVGLDRQEDRERTARELAGFWEALGNAKHRAVNELVARYNKSQDIRHIRESKECIEECEYAFDQGKRWDPTMSGNIRVRSARDHNKELLGQMSKMFGL